MRSTNITFPVCFTILLLLAGCTTTPKSNYSYSPEQQQTDKDKLIQAREQFVDAIKAENIKLHKEVDQLKAENAVLNKAKVNEAALKSLADHLQINDNIVERKQVIIQDFQKNWEKQKDALFSAMGGTGQLDEFQVEDVFFYKSAIQVTMLFLWSNTDGSGGVSRGCITLNPDKNDEMTDCSMLGQVLISAQEYAALNQGNAGQIQQQATQIDRHTESPSSFLSEKTKQKLIDGGIDLGIAAAGAYLVKLINEN